MCPTPRLQLQHAGLYLLVDPLLADQQGPARSSQQPAEGDDETDDSEATWRWGFRVFGACRVRGLDL